MAQGETAYRPEIDGIRAIAVTSVILYHLGLGAFSGGYVGVDIFFVISGYLIGAILMREMADGRFSFAAFYERRIRRIFPALFVVLIATTIAAWVLLTPGQLRNYGQSLVATVGFVSNLYFNFKSGYFSPAADEIPLLHMWSLSVEEQFYIVFPVILLAVYRYARRWLEAILWAGLIVSLGWSLWLERADPTGNFFLPHPRAWELAAGAIVAVARPRWDAEIASGGWPWRAIEVVGAALMIAPILHYTPTTSFPGVYAIPPVLGTALVILAATERSWTGRILASPPFVGIGLISYSAYLWHQPLFAFARVSGGHAPSAALQWSLVAATFALAWLSWRFVERPFRSRTRFSRRQIFAMAALVSLPLIAVGLAFHVSKGAPQRYDAPTLALAATAQPSPHRDDCHTDGLDFRKPVEACRYFPGPARWAVMGDSHAIEPAYALAERLRGQGEGIVHLTFSGCQPALTFESENPGCSAWTRETVALLERDKSVVNVMLVYRHSFYLFGNQLDSYPALPNDKPNFLLGTEPDDARRRYWAGYREIVRRLVASGKQVYLVAPIPDLPVHVERDIFTGKKVGEARAYADARNRVAAIKIARLAGPGVTILRPEDSFCGKDRCASIIDGKAMYFDDNHLSMAGARRFITTEAAAGRLP